MTDRIWNRTRSAAPNAIARIAWLAFCVRVPALNKKPSATPEP